jgi:hypothetical protein
MDVGGVEGRRGRFGLGERRSTQSENHPHGKGI